MAVQASVAVPAARSKSVAISWPMVAVVVASLFRLLLIAVPSHGYDSFAYKHWTWRLVHEPITNFYVDDGQSFPDHLPGDIWLFKLLGESAHLVDPNIDFYGSSYGVLISLLAISFDAILALALLGIGRLLGRPEQGQLAAIAYWCAPAPIFIASAWGQIDGVSTALAVIALGLALAGRFSSAFIALTLCVLVKPQFAVLALPLIVGWWRANRFTVAIWARHVGVTGIACSALLATIVAPFGMSLVGEWGRWSLLDRVRHAGDTYTVSVLGAHNFWVLFDPFNWPPDDRIPWILGISRYGIGIAMFLAVAIYASWILVARWRGACTMVMASNILLLGFFLFATRMHERYIFPVVALSMLLWLVDGRYRGYAIAVGGLAVANIVLRFTWPINNDWTGWKYLAGFEWLEHAWFVRLLALMTLGVFAWLCVEAGRRKRY